MSRSHRESHPLVPYRWVVLGAAFCILVLHGGIWYSLSVFLKPLTVYFGWSRAAVSAAQSIFAITFALAGMVIGRLTDKVGPKTVLLFGGLCLSIGLLLTSRVDDIWQLYTFYGVVVGIGASTFYVPLMAVVAGWFLGKKGFALGMASSGIGVGMLVISPLIRHFISLYGWRVSYMLLAVGSLVVVTAASLFIRRNPKEADSEPGNERSMISGSKGGVVGDPDGKDWVAREAVRTKAFWSVSFLHGFCAVALGMVLVHMVAYATDKGITPIIAASALGLIGGFGIIGRIAMGYTSDRIGRRSALAVCFILQALMLLWLSKTGSIWMLSVFVIVFGFSYGGGVPQFPAIIGDFFGLSHMATILAINLAFAGLGAAIGPLLAGYIFDVTGSYFSVFLLGTIIFAISVPVVFFIKSPKRSPE